MDATFEEVVKLAEQLDDEQQNLLIYRLRVKQIRERKPQTTGHSELFYESGSPTREDLIREAEVLRRTPLHSDNSLLGKYANPNVPEMSEEEFHAQMHAIATEWEQKLDDLYQDES